MINILKILKFFFSTLGSMLFTVFLGLAAIFQLFMEDFSDSVNEFGIKGVIIVVLAAMSVSLMITFVWFYIKVNKNETQGKSEIIGSKNFFETMISEFEKKLDKGEYTDVIQVGSSLSRILWLSGDYKNRIKVGDLVHKAAILADDQKSAAHMLIDDIGWTYFVTGKVKNAKDNINKGINLALSSQDYYYVAKGYRHLFNISLQQNFEIEANNYLNEAEQNSNNIVDAKEKSEMKNGIQYDKIELLIRQNQYNIALSEAEQVLQVYTSAKDNKRKSKVYSIMGKIAFLQGNYDKSIEYFILGFHNAHDNNRKDEMIKNSMGLTVSYLKKGDVKRSNKYYQRTLAIQGTEHISFLYWEVINEQFENINY